MTQSRRRSPLRSALTTVAKIVLTVAAFYVLLNHKITDESNVGLLLPDGSTEQIAVGDSLALAQGNAVVVSSRQLAVDGTIIHIHAGDFLQRSDGLEAQVLQEGSTTTYRAIRAYLPRIHARTFWLFLLIGAVVKAVGILASMLRWHILLLGQRIRFPFGHLAGTFLIGRFLGTFLPSTVGLDGYTLYDAARHSRRTVEVAAAKFIEKIMGIVGILLTFLVTLPLGYAVFQHNLGQNAARVTTITVVISFAAIGAFFFVLLRPQIVDPFIRLLPKESKPRKLLRHIREAAGAYDHRKGILVGAAFLSFLVHFLTAVMYYFTARAIGATGANVWEISFASSIQIFATVISPFTIAGEGVREIVTYVLLGGMMGGEATILFSALGFWAAEALTLAGAVVWLARRRGYAPRYVEVEGIRLDPAAPVPVVPRPASSAPRVPAGRRIVSGLMGGLFGGAFLGFLEALLVIRLANQDEMWVLPYAFLLYGLCGAAMGAVAGVLIEPVAHVSGRREVRGTTFALAFAGIFALMGAVVTRFRLVRDLFRERPPQGMLLPLAVLCAAVLVGVVLFVLMRKLARRGGPLAPLREPLTGPLVYAGLLGALLLVAWWGESEAPAGSVDPAAQARVASRPNVLLIVVDTMRADRLGCYGYPHDTSPALDAMAAEGIVFKHTVAQASWTKPSIATILTGLYPSTHQATSKVSTLPDAVVTMAEVFHAQGYYTAGFADNINIAPMFGFGQGFCEYRYLAPAYFFGASESASKLTLYDLVRLVRERFLSKAKHVDHYYRDAEYVTDEAIGWLKRNKDRPFFLFVHYMDPHDPYFVHPYNGVGYARVSTPNPPLEMAPKLSTVYDQEIAFWDRSFADLMAHLRSEGILDSTIVVVTADHGEEFAEHGGWWHGTTLYDVEILVPLVIRMPHAVSAGTVITPQVRLMDVAPTLLASCGLPVPAAMQGQPLNWERSDFRGIDTVFAEEDFEGNLLTAVRTPDWKLIRANQHNPRGLDPLELYNVAADPRERVSRVKDNPDAVRALQATIDDIQHEAMKVAVQSQTHELDADTKKQLRALGYME
ncbi:sulfatase-like hydrolase/transferase [Candidatus Fermentibacteria bacterium]|nr:sulfatase-like hydrolase/transferase [Candidatus Fermentibacteria bacterium]